MRFYIKSVLLYLVVTFLFTIIALYVVGGGAKIEDRIVSLHLWYNIFVLIFLLLLGITKKDNRYLIVAIPLVSVIVFLFTNIV